MPNDVSDERVKECLPKWIKRYYDSYLAEGWSLMSKVFTKKGLPTTEDIMQGHSRWLIFAYWDRAPRKVTLEVDEKYIPGLLATGRFHVN